MSRGFVKTMNNLDFQKVGPRGAITTALQAGVDALKQVESMQDQIKTPTEERDEYAAEARRQMMHVDTVLQERDALKAALEEAETKFVNNELGAMISIIREALKPPPSPSA